MTHVSTVGNWGGWVWKHDRTDNEYILALKYIDQINMVTPAATWVMVTIRPLSLLSVCTYSFMTLNPGRHHYGQGWRWPVRLCGKRGMGVPRDASHQECHHVRMLLWPVSGHHIHGASAASLLLLHLQPPTPLFPHLLLSPSGVLPACGLWGEGFSRSDGSPGSHCVPANGGWEHASIRECAAHR